MIFFAILALTITASAVYLVRQTLTRELEITE